MNRESVEKGKYFTVIFWMVALSAWVLGWDGGIGGLVQTLAKLLAIIHIAEIFIFGDLIEKQAEDEGSVLFDERIKVFAYGYFRIKELELDKEGKEEKE